MRKPESNSNSNNQIEAIKLDNYKVLRAVCVGNNNAVLADIELNGVRIYGVRVVEGKNGDFLSFPQSKGKDGKYYSIVWCKLNDKDSTDILAAIESKLNG